MELSVLIPSRNEEWLARTVHDLLDNCTADTEILVGLDGAPAISPIPEDPRVTVLYYPTSIGQRAMTNQLCKLSKAKYVAKVDAHCAFAKGWDTEMIRAMEELGSDVTMVPVMRNLHVFNWVCPDGHSRYQGPSGPCTECGKPTEKDVVWIAKKNPQSTSYRFDHELHFQYFNEYTKRKETPYSESMSLQGSFFMLTREKYWELNICDEAFGSWGAQGTEVACKTWLSGGRVVVNHNTWYAHLFRTQGGDFSFPYEQDNKQVANARKLSQKLFLDNTWPLQKYPLIWLIDKFAPVPGWHDGTDNGMLEKVRIWGDKFGVK